MYRFTCQPSVPCGERNGYVATARDHSPMKLKNMPSMHKPPSIITYTLLFTLSIGISTCTAISSLTVSQDYHMYLLECSPKGFLFLLTFPILLGLYISCCFINQQLIDVTNNVWLQSINNCM